MGIVRAESGFLLAAAAVAALLAACIVQASAAPAAPVQARIVSLAPSITETLFALGAGSEVVGVSEYCDYPEQVRRLPRVGSFLTPNVEMIAGLRPTLVIGLEISSNQREVRAIQAMGYPMLLISDDTLEDIRAAILEIGERIGRAQRARELVAEIDSHIEAARARLANTPPRKVLMLVGHQPIVAVGRGTYLDELLKLAGGINIAAAGSTQEWPHLGIEYIIAMAPDVILDGQMGGDPSSPNGFWAQYPSIPAVRNHRVYGYPQNPMLRTGPRVGQSLDILIADIHPEVAARSLAGGAGPERHD